MMANQISRKSDPGNPTDPNDESSGSGRSGIEGNLRSTDFNERSGIQAEPRSGNVHARKSVQRTLHRLLRCCFRNILTDRLGNYQKPAASGLKYQQEYILGANDNDRANLTDSREPAASDP